MMMTGPHDKRDIQTHQVIVSIILHPYPFISETPLLSLFKIAMDLLGPGSVIIILFISFLEFTFFLDSSLNFSMVFLAFHISFIIFPVSWWLFCLYKNCINLSSGIYTFLSKIQ